MSTPNRLSEPRSYLGTAIMLGMYFAVCMWLFSSVWGAVVADQPVSAAIRRGMVVAAVSGLGFGVVMGAFFRGDSRRVRVDDPEAFMARVNIAAAEIGYHPALIAPTTLAFRPGWHAGLLAGRILVQLGNHEAVVVGPRIYVGRLVARLEPAA